MANLEVAFIADDHQVEVDGSVAQLAGIRAPIIAFIVEIIVFELPFFGHRGELYWKISS
jgi:hypothetical protein